METDTRQPAFAGSFYAGEAGQLRDQVGQLLKVDANPHQLLVCLAPHAGYLYSGGVAGTVYGHLELPPVVIVLGPNHHGLGASIAVAPHQAWQLPGLRVPIAQELAAEVVRRVAAARLDPQAHWREHSIEVQLPFLQARRPDVTVLPICLGHLSLPECLQLGAALAGLVRDWAEPIGIVVSSDMSHYLPDATAREIDRLAIDAALSLDPEQLFTTARQHAAMCGFIPATVGLAAACELGQAVGHLVDYATSGDVSGDRTAVVGYAGICYHRPDVGAA